MSSLSSVLYSLLIVCAVSLKAPCPSNKNEFLVKHVPKSYCAKFEVNSVPIKVKIDFKNSTNADIWATVYGFDMYCLDAPFTMCDDGAMDLDPRDEGEENCLRKQFEGVDEHLNALVASYSEDKDEVVLNAQSFKDKFMTKERCHHTDMKFKVMPERRLSLEAIKAMQAAPQFV